MLFHTGVVSHRCCSHRCCFTQVLFHAGVVHAGVVCCGQSLKRLLELERADRVEQDGQAVKLFADIQERYEYAQTLRDEQNRYSAAVALAVTFTFIIKQVQCSCSAGSRFHFHNKTGTVQL